MNHLILLTTTALALSGITSTSSVACFEEQAAEEITITHFAEPSDYFVRAWISFLYSHNEATADHIRRGARSVAIEAEDATGDIRKALLDSYTELNDMAVSVENGDYITVIELGRNFARALYNLSSQQMQVTREVYAEGNYTDTGIALFVAVNNLRHAYGWFNEVLSEEEYKDLADIHAIAEELEYGEKADADAALTKLQKLHSRMGYLLIADENGDILD